MFRITYISLEPSFLSIHVLEMVNALVDEGAIVTLIFPLGAEGTHNLHPDVQQVPVQLGSGWLDYFLTPIRLFAHLIRRRKDRPDIIYVRQDIHYTLLPAMIRLLKIPYWAEFNQCARIMPENKSFFRGSLTTVMEMTCLFFASRIVAPSRALVDVFADCYPVLRSSLEYKAMVVANAANPRLFGTADDRKQIRQRLGLDADMCWIGFVGSLLPWQGVDVFLRAMERLAQQQVDVRSLIVGGFDIYGEAETRHRLEALPAFRQSHVTGKVDYVESAAWMAACDILVAPYTSAYLLYGGGAPMKVYAYLASGRPVVVSALDGWTEHEWITEKGAGVSVPSDDDEALARTLAALARDSNRREDMGKKARQLVESAHDWRHRARLLLSQMEKG